MAKLIPWNDPQTLRAVADMQRKIAESMCDLACRMIMEGAVADTEQQLRTAEIEAIANVDINTRDIPGASEAFFRRARKMDGGSHGSSSPPSG